MSHPNALSQKNETQSSSSSISPTVKINMPSALKDKLAVFKSTIGSTTQSPKK